MLIINHERTDVWQKTISECSKEKEQDQKRTTQSHRSTAAIFKTELEKYKRFAGQVPRDEFPDIRKRPEDILGNPAGL